MKAGELKLKIQELLGIPEAKRAQNIGPLTESAFQKLKGTPNNMEWGTAETGIDRTDWKGFRQVNVDALTKILPKPAEHLAASFIDTAKYFGLHPLFLVAISRHETGNWTSNAFRNLNNAMGISNSKGVTTQVSHGASIIAMARSITRPDGHYRNCKTLADVGKVYAPVGAANDPKSQNSYWPGLVARYMEEYEKALT